MNLVAETRVTSPNAGYNEAAFRAVVALCRERGITKVRKPEPLFIEVQIARAAAIAAIPASEAAVAVALAEDAESDKD